MNASDLFAKLSSGDRFALSKAITLVESKREQDLALASDLLQMCEKEEVSAVTIAFTGPPGVGKSSLIEQVGLQCIKQEAKIAVLAIDPSSTYSRGSILGDKSRMQELGKSDRAFIRPSPDQALGGGVAIATYEVSLLCAVAGFETIFLETVGVGQSETAIAHLADLIILMIQPGAGDDLQSIKRGIVEMADILLVSKADGEYEKYADQAVSYFSGMLGVRENSWQQTIHKVSAVSLIGIPELLQEIQSFENKVDLNLLRRERTANWLQWRLQHEMVHMLQQKLANSIERESTALRAGLSYPSTALAQCRIEIKELLGL